MGVVGNTFLDPSASHDRYATKEDGNIVEDKSKKVDLFIVKWKLELSEIGMT